MNAASIQAGLSIRNRLFLGFASLILPLIIILIVFLIKINHVETFMKQRSTMVPILMLLSNLDAQIYEAQTDAYDWVLTGEQKAKQDFVKIWETIRATEIKMNELLGISKDQVISDQWKRFSADYPKLRDLQEQFFKADHQTLKPELLANSQAVISRMLALLDGSDNSNVLGLVAMQEQRLNAGAAHISEDMGRLEMWVYGILILTLFLAIVVSSITAKKILKSIASYSAHSAKIAAGDLRQRLTIETRDELGALGTDLNTMTEGLSDITKKITEASGNMVSLLDEVKKAAQMQSTGISEQASSINQITASLEEIDKSASQTMEKAKILGQTSEETSEKGQKGLEAVQQSIEGMTLIEEKVQTIATTILELSNQTQQIGEITTVVNTLALQSKMLALNASIEAAKAGEAGKGFAVVAAEVKNLAEQSEQATTQVQKILEDIRHGTERAVIVTEEGAKGVAEGTQVVEQMGEIMQSLTAAINDGLLASQQIEIAVRQESLGIEQITTGMNEINQVTASFVDTVKQTTRLINQLNEMAAHIKQCVDTYKV